MGEAKRRQKLDPNYGHNYPPQENNWIFTSASDEIAVNNLNQCLFMAGVTTTDHYQRQYSQPLTDNKLTEKEKSSLLTSALLSHVAIDNQQYQLLFAQAVKTGSVFVVFDDDDPDIFSHHICYDPRRAQFFRDQGY
jgi:hypothetical protein